MKYFPLIWAALGRRKPRTILTGLSIAIAFLLYGMLNAVNVAFNNGVEVAGVDRLVTTGRYSITQILPAGHGQQIRSLPGVASVAASNWFGGYYQDQHNFFPQFAVEQEQYLGMYPEIVLPPDQKQAFFNTQHAHRRGRRQDTGRALPLEGRRQDPDAGRHLATQGWRQCLDL